MNKHPIRLAIFDLDHTLLDGDSDQAWCEFLSEQKIVNDSGFLAKRHAYFTAYQAGTLDIHDYLSSFALKILTQHPKAELQRWRKLFFNQKIKLLISKQALALIDKHRQASHHLMIITATNRFVTEPIAEFLQINTLIASEPEEKNGEYTGNVLGIPSFQAGKTARLHEWLEKNHYTLAESFFYSDSHNDLPLLQEVDHPCAVNPDPILLEYAQKMGWPITRW